MTTPRPRPLGDGARLRRDRSVLADAQRRFNAAHGLEDECRSLSPTPDPSPPPPHRASATGTPAGGGERREPAEHSLSRDESCGPCLTPLTGQARALYEGRVVPVRELARLCGVSVRTLYHHVHKQGWRRRRSSVPRDPARSARQRARYRAWKASQPQKPRGLKARDPQGQAAALATAEQAGALAGAALARAIARQDAEARARMLALLVRALRDLAAVETGELAARRRSAKAREASAKAERAAWRPMRVSPPR